MFAILFGLSMDYEVFLVSQIEEHHHAGEENKSSVVSGRKLSPITTAICSGSLLEMSAARASSPAVLPPTYARRSLPFSAVGIVLLRELVDQMGSLLLGWRWPVPVGDTSLERQRCCRRGRGPFRACSFSACS